MREPNGIVWMSYPVQPIHGEEYLLYVLHLGERRYAVGVWVEGEGFYESTTEHGQLFVFFSHRELKQHRLICPVWMYNHGYAYFARLPACPDHLLMDKMVDDVLSTIRNFAFDLIFQEAAEMSTHYSGLDDSAERSLKDFQQRMKDAVAEHYKNCSKDNGADTSSLEQTDGGEQAKSAEKSPEPEENNDSNEAYPMSPREAALRRQYEQEAEEYWCCEDALIDSVREEFNWEYLREKESSLALADFALRSFDIFIRRLGEALKYLFIAESAEMSLAAFAGSEYCPVEPETRAFIEKWFRTADYWLTRDEVPEEELQEDEAPMPEEFCDMIDRERLGGTSADKALLFRLERFVSRVRNGCSSMDLDDEIESIAKDYLWWAADSRAVIEE